MSRKVTLTYLGQGVTDYKGYFIEPCEIKDDEEGSIRDGVAVWKNLEDDSLCGYFVNEATAKYYIELWQTNPAQHPPTG